MKTLEDIVINAYKFTITTIVSPHYLYVHIESTNSIISSACSRRAGQEALITRLTTAPIGINQQYLSDLDTSVSKHQTSRSRSKDIIC